MTDIVEWLRKEAELVALDRLSEAADEIERLRALSQNNAHSWDALVKVRNDLQAEIERLRAAGDAAFYAMCAYRDDCDTELFQDAIDALGTALKDTKP